MESDMADTPSILVIDDHEDIRDGLVKYLMKNGMRATAVADAKAMDAALMVGSFDLLVLDLMLPGEDGLAICRRLSTTTHVPILMLTALGEETDRIVGLELGADDYLSKPFNPRELLARIKAILRRSERVEFSGASLVGQRLFFDRWTFEVDRQILTDGTGTTVSLTTAEFRLLTVFVERPHIVLSRDQLLDLTSGRAAQVYDRTIDNQVSRLRRKIERDPSEPTLITTVWGGGYSLSVDVLSGQ